MSADFCFRDGFRGNYFVIISSAVGIIACRYSTAPYSRDAMRTWPRRPNEEGEVRGKPRIFKGLLACFDVEYDGDG